MGLLREAKIQFRQTLVWILLWRNFLDEFNIYTFNKDSFFFFYKVDFLYNVKDLILIQLVGGLEEKNKGFLPGLEA